MEDSGVMIAAIGAVATIGTALTAVAIAKINKVHVMANSTLTAANAAREAAIEAAKEMKLLYVTAQAKIVGLEQLIAEIRQPSVPRTAGPVEVEVVQPANKPVPVKDTPPE